MPLRYANGVKPPAPETPAVPATVPTPARRPYRPPHLEAHLYTVVTGASFPIGTNGLPNPFERDQHY